MRRPIDEPAHAAAGPAFSYGLRIWLGKGSLSQLFLFSVLIAPFVLLGAERAGQHGGVGLTPGFAFLSGPAYFRD